VGHWQWRWSKTKKTSAIKTALTSDKAKNIYKTTGKIATTAAISGIITIGAANIYGLQAKTLYAMGTSALSGIIGQIESKLLNKDVINENDISESVLRENIVGEEYIRENVLRENVIEENMLRSRVTK
jgi:coproporphyrinogen III oxidase-like Fe-S oxidoreductase